MPKGVSRVGVDTAGGIIVGNLAPTVFVNDVPIVVIGAEVSGHGLPPHSSPVMVEGSGIIFANGIGVVAEGDLASCDDVATGSPNVFLGLTVDNDTPSNRAMNEIDEEDAVNPGGAEVLINDAVQRGSVSSGELAVGNSGPASKGGDVVEGPKDQTPPANTATILTSDCSDIASIDPFPSGDEIDNIVLSPNYTVGRLTRKPFVVFDNALRSGTGGLSLEEIICNLKLLAINVIEPIKAQYPNAFVTNSWRPAGIGSPTSQHPKGMACDIQFKNIGKKDYYNIAQWCRDNLVYDQLLLEYKTTGSGLPWIHISFDKSKNKKQVLTFMNNRTYAQGLVDLSAT